jgi:hypothetical protein
MTAIIAASILAIFTMSSPAFAYSNVSPKPAPQQVTTAHSHCDNPRVQLLACFTYSIINGPKESE